MIFSAGALQQAGHRNFTCMPAESPAQVRKHIGLRPCMNAISLDAPNTTTRYRTIFISDLHLGTRGCRIEFLADFLRRTSSDRLYLIGDIVDGWRLRKSWYWDAAHDEVLKLILRKARNGTEVTYIPGNHDEMFRTWLPMGLEVCGICLRGEAVHETADGRRLLVIALGALLTAATLLLEIILWAWVYRHVGAIHGLKESLYFSGITFTTVGYGDITLMKCWRLLSVGEAINGVLMAGWSTAQLIFIVQRAMTMQSQYDELKSMASHQKPDQVAQ